MTMPGWCGHKETPSVRKARRRIKKWVHRAQRRVNKELTKE